MSSRLSTVLTLVVLGALCLTASASPLCTDSTATFNIGGGVTNDPVSCLGLTFNNWQAIAKIGSPSGSIAVAGYDTGSTVFLDFSLVLLSNQDINVYFTVTGPLLGIDLFNGGSGPTLIIEKACSVGFGEVPGNNRPASRCTGTLLADINAMSNGSSNFLFTGGQSNLTYIFKDIGTQSGGAMSDFTESFHTSVPEPTTFVLLGAGLLVIGAIARRRRATK